MTKKTYFQFIICYSSLVCLYNFRKKGLFLGGQNVISWGAQGGTGGGAFAPPSLYVKKGPVSNYLDLFLS